MSKLFPKSLSAPAIQPSVQSAGHRKPKHASPKRFDYRSTKPGEEGRYEVSACQQAVRLHLPEGYKVRELRKNLGASITDELSCLRDVQRRVTVERRARNTLLKSKERGNLGNAKAAKWAPPDKSFAHDTGAEQAKWDVPTRAQSPWQPVPGSLTGDGFHKGGTMKVGKPHPSPPKVKFERWGGLGGTELMHEPGAGKKKSKSRRAKGSQSQASLRVSAGAGPMTPGYRTGAAEPTTPKRVTFQNSVQPSLESEAQAQEEDEDEDDSANMVDWDSFGEPGPDGGATLPPMAAAAESPARKMGSAASSVDLIQENLWADMPNRMNRQNQVDEFFTALPVLPTSRGSKRRIAQGHVL
jgi:hypothetical protein